MSRALAAAAVAAGCILSSCGGGSSGSVSTPTGPSSVSGNALIITITRQNGTQSFSPNPADAGGKTVVFRNADTIVHRVQLNDGSIDTGNLAPGATSSTVTMPMAGTNYHCTLHPDMIGAVSGTSGEPPACTGVYCQHAD
jgi:plastocyanin